MARFSDDFWSAALLISGIDYEDVETTGTFNIIARDEHGVTGTEIISGRTFKIDTKAPRAPQIIPDYPP